MEAELHARSTCNRMLSLTAAASAASAEVPSLREVELHPRTVVSDLFMFFLKNVCHFCFQLQIFSSPCYFLTNICMFYLLSSPHSGTPR